LLIQQNLLQLSHFYFILLSFPPDSKSPLASPPDETPILRDTLSGFPPNPNPTGRRIVFPGVPPGPEILLTPGSSAQIIFSQTS